MARIITNILILICIHADAQSFFRTQYVLESNPVSLAFSFNISGTKSTSAGVYKNDSILVRTLWNNESLIPGTYDANWDMNDDQGRRLPDVPYTIKVLSNNVQYEWEGAYIGNTSDSMTGQTKHRALYNCMTGLAFAGNYGYFCTGFSEGLSAVRKFNINTPQQAINFTGNYSGKIIDLNTTYVATDGVNVYWAGFDSYSPAYQGQYNSMVYATRTSDDARVTFTNGISYSMSLGSIVLNSISKINGLSAIHYISGLAVQKNHNYLFVARAGLNQLQVINKSTGAVAQTLSYTNPGALCVDNSDNLWMVTGNTVSKYAVNLNGTLSAPILTLSGLLQPLAIQAYGSTISVADGSTSQQVKSFSTSTGAASWTLGTAGGYFTDAAVNNNKFYFSDVQGYDHKNRPVFLAYQSTGHLWVGDGGNSRVQHYNSTRTFVDRIMSLPASYHVYVDPNNPTRIWSDGLEFSVDYNQPLKSSWTLKNNWGANIDTNYSVVAFEEPTTLSNGHTYALIKRIAGYSTREVVEFLSSGILRFTGVISHGARVISPDGAIQTYNRAALGSSASVSRYSLTGFDGLNNPVWNLTAEILATTPELTINDPTSTFLTGNNCITSTNKVIIWNPDTFLDSLTIYPGDHLAAIQRGGNNWLWRTERSTNVNYRGNYPGAGWFDIGNNVRNNSGGTLSILGRNIITSYHGEFWKNAQTNKYNHYWDNGLAIGQLGTTRDDVNKAPAAAMMAGNALTPMIVQDPNDINAMYLYHGDEADHGAIHRWHITGLNTISTQTISFQ